MTKKLSEEQVRTFIVNENCEWLSGEYKNNSSKLGIVFECGCFGEISLNNFKSGKRCRLHSQIKSSAQRRIPDDDIVDFIESYGFEFVSFIQKGMGRKSSFEYRCEFGHFTERQYKDFINHPTCSTCEKERLSILYRNTEEYLSKKIEEKECFLNNVIFYKNRKDSLLDIEFSCGHIERISFGNFLGRKTGLCVNCEILSRRGETSYAWRGGLTPLTNYIRKELGEWNKFCAKEHNYLCVITDLPMEHIHHLQSFNLILVETMQNLNIEIKKSVYDYTEEELGSILDMFFYVQDKYPMGVPITKMAHDTFHRIYGRGNNTPEQFYEFVERINSGEIEI